MFEAALDRLAALFAYPAGAPARAAGDLAADLGPDCPEAAERLSEFAAAMARLGRDQQQELFVRTFDLNPLCCLEVGWQLHGDHYERGRFLADMRGRLREFGVAESSELPDHLSHVLLLLGRMPEEESESLAARAVLPAVERMHAGLEPAAENPYRHLLRATRAIVRLMAGQARQEVHP